MITALLVSVNYSDYLEVALPYNTKQFDEIIVLTIESDKSCQDLCSKYSNVKCLVFPDGILKKNGRQFNKGALLNKGFEYLNEIGYSDWLVMTDSDIVFPENFKELILSKEKDPRLLFHLPRKFVRKKAELEEALSRPFDDDHDHVESHFDNSGRPISKKNMTHRPCGFLSGFIYQPYKFCYNEWYDANRSDFIFNRHFIHVIRQMKKKPLFKLIRTSFVVHLGQNSLNWKGRKTQSFK